MNGDWQTILSAKCALPRRTPFPSSERYRYLTPDGDFIDVDLWCSQEKRADPSASKRPGLILFHGLEGSSASHYARALASMCLERGWYCFVPHFRGCSGEINWRPRAYHSGDVQDVDWLLQHFRSRHEGPLYAVGVSLGGNALMRWAGEWAERARSVVDAMAAVSAPLDLVASGEALCSGFNRYVYGRMFLRTMWAKARAKWQQYPGSFDLEAALRARDLKAFDDAFTAPLHGFRDVMDYWTHASAKPWLGAVRVPALLLNARNDPFVPAWSLPTPGEVSSWITLAQPQRGGHVGFAEGVFPGSMLPWAHRLGDWLERAHHPTTNSMEATRLSFGPA